MAQRTPVSLLPRLMCVGILAVALAYTEACVVVYLREAIAPVRRVHFPSAVHEVLPLLTTQQLADAGVQFPRLLIAEVTREMTPILVLLAMAWGLRRRKGELVAFFLLGFGVWDIFYYVFLKVLLGWPASLATWDVLFLIPTAWVAPVWAPLVVAATLALTGLAILYRGGGRPAGRRPLPAWFMIVLGTGLILTSFFLRTGEAFHTVAPRFDWPWFLAGWLIGVGGLVWLLRAGHSGSGHLHMGTA